MFTLLFIPYSTNTSGIEQDLNCCQTKKIVAVYLEEYLFWSIEFLKDAMCSSTSIRISFQRKLYSLASSRLQICVPISRAFQISQRHASKSAPTPIFAVR